MVKKSKDEKIFRGAFNYYRYDNLFCEETFDVYRDRKEHLIIFDIIMQSRVATGELLTINAEYTVNKDYQPTKVIVHRELGEKSVHETYIYRPRAGILTYKFDDGTDVNQVEITPPSKFHITIPATSPSMLLLRSKKFDNSGKNYFNTLGTNNLWEFEEEPNLRSIAIQKTSTTPEKLTIDGHNVQSVVYKLFEAQENVEKPDPPLNECIRIFLSNHMSIPYVVRTEDGTKIQVKYLNNLQKEDS